MKINNASAEITRKRKKRDEILDSILKPYKLQHNTSWDDRDEKYLTKKGILGYLLGFFKYPIYIDFDRETIIVYDINYRVVTIDLAKRFEELWPEHEWTISNYTYSGEDL